MAVHLSRSPPTELPGSGNPKNWVFERTVQIIREGGDKGEPRIFFDKRNANPEHLSE
jgi:hypothetical protein